MRTTKIRSLLVISIAVLSTIAASQPALAFDSGPRGKKLEGDRKNKVMRAIYMLTSVFSPADTFEGLFGAGGTNTDYTKTNGQPTTIHWGMAQLRHMVATGQLREHELDDRALTCRDEKGIKRDRVWIKSETIDEMCDKPASTGDDITSDVCQAAANLTLAATLMNELIHVFQVAGDTDYRRECDAEKDSDCASRSEERRVGKECRSRWSPYH